MEAFVLLSNTLSKSIEMAGLATGEVVKLLFSGVFKMENKQATVLSKCQPRAGVPGGLGSLGGGWCYWRAQRRGETRTRHRQTHR